MIVNITWPGGTNVEFSQDTADMTPDGVDTFLRQVHDLAGALVRDAIELGLEVGDSVAEVETQLDEGEV